MMKKTIFSGFGGQGVLMMGYVLAVSAMRDGKEVTYLPSYGAEVRGGTANCTVAVADEKIFSPVASSPDYGVIMNNPSLTRYESAIKSGGIIILNSSLIDTETSREDLQIIRVPGNDLAKKLGSDRTINMIMLGALVQKTGLTTLGSIMDGLGEILKDKKVAAKLMKLNQKGLDLGAEYAEKGVST